MLIVQIPEALDLIQPLDKPGDRDYGFSYNAEDQLELIHWQSVAHPKMPSQKEIAEAEDQPLPQPSDLEESLGITPEHLLSLLPIPNVYIYANNESEIPTLVAGRRFFYTPENIEYFAYQPDPKTQGEWWSEPIYDGGGTNGNLAQGRAIRRFNNMLQNLESGIPLRPALYRLCYLEASWQGSQQEPKIDILIGKTVAGVATEGDSYSLSHNFTLNSEGLFEVAAGENLVLRWQGGGIVRQLQARLMFRRVLFPDQRA